MESDINAAKATISSLEVSKADIQKELSLIQSEKAALEGRLDERDASVQDLTEKVRSCFQWRIHPLTLSFAIALRRRSRSQRQARQT